MNKVQKIGVAVVTTVAAAGSAFADGNADICTTLTAAAGTAMSEIQTAVGTLLTAALGIAVGFVVYGAIRKAMARGK